MSGNPRVVVTQAGARHNYALPAAFAEAGMLDAFHTDICGGRGIGRLAELAAHLPLPGGIRATAVRIAGRRPPPEVLARTTTDDWGTLLFEREVRRAPTPLAARQVLVRHTQAAGLRMARHGLGQATHLYSIFGHGWALAREANARGIPVLTDMIIALSTRRIVMEEHARWPDWGPPPPDQSYSLLRDFNPDEEMLATTDVFVCPSSFVADDLVNNWGIARERTRIIPYALSAQWFDVVPNPVPGRVLFAGTADLRKGIHTLAFAAGRLGTGIEVRVAGNVNSMVRARPEAASLNFLGRVPRAEVQEEFARADLFVLPTLAEGSATVVYEAMAAGLPVITTRSAGSVIEHGVDGLIVPERDPDALAAAIERLVEDRPLRDAMGGAARKKSRQFGWADYARQLRELVLATTPDTLLPHTFRSTWDSGM